MGAEHSTVRVAATARGSAGRLRTAPSQTETGSREPDITMTGGPGGVSHLGDMSGAGEGAVVSFGTPVERSPGTVFPAEHNLSSSTSYLPLSGRRGSMATDRIAALANVHEVAAVCGVEVDVDRFYSDVLWELGVLTQPRWFSRRRCPR